MRKTRKIYKMTAVLMALLFTVALCVTACSKKVEEKGTTKGTTAAQDDSKKEDPKLDKSEYYEIVLIKDDADPKAEEFKDQNYFRQQLKEKFNFGYKLINYSGDLGEKLGLMLSAGDYPDIVALTDVRYLKAYVEADALMELTSLIENYGPNIQQTHKDRIPYWKSIMSGLNDGNIWFWTIWEPNFGSGVNTPQLEWKLRSDVLEQQNHPDIVTEDDIYAFLKKGVEENPKTNGMPTVGFTHPLSSWGTNGLLCLTHTINMGPLSHGTRKYGSVYNPNTDEYMDVARHYIYKEGLRFFNKLWREGLFDRDAITDNYETFTKKMEEGRALATYFYNWSYDDWNKKLAQAGRDFAYIPFAATLKSIEEHGDKKLYPKPFGDIWGSCSMTRNAQYPERLMEVLDWCMSPEGLIAAGWGEEGEQYEIKNGKRIPTQKHLDNTKNDPDYGAKWRGESSFGLFGGLDDNGQCYIMDYDNEYIKLTTDPKILETYSEYGWDSVYDQQCNNEHFEADMQYDFGLAMFVPSYDDNTLKNFEKIDALTHDYTMKLVTAKSEEDFEAIFEEMLKKRDELGLPEMIEERNSQYSDLKANWSE